jgi:hypothetical protein
MGRATLIAIKVVLMIFGILVSVILCTIAYGILASIIYGLKAISLPWLLRDPFYWLFMILVVGGEIWLGINTVARW